VLHDLKIEAQEAQANGLKGAEAASLLLVPQGPSMKKDEDAEGHLEQSAPDEAGRSPKLQSAGSKSAATGGHR